MKPIALSVADARARFPLLEEVNWLLDMVGDRVTLYQGDVTRDEGDILGLVDFDDSADDEDGSAIIVDGNLTFTTAAGWGDRGDFSNDVLLVTGDLRAPGLELGRVGAVVVGGSAAIRHVYVHHGDDGGALHIAGDLEAEVIIATTYFVTTVGGELRVEHFIGDNTYACDVAKGRAIINAHGHANRFVSEVQTGGELDCQAVFERLCDGLEVFVNRGAPRTEPYKKTW